MAVFAGYLLGSISFARLMLRMVASQSDLSALRILVVGIAEMASVDVCGSNAASMVLGARFGLVTGFLDVFKVCLPTLAFTFLYPEQVYYLAVAVAPHP